MSLYPVIVLLLIHEAAASIPLRAYNATLTTIPEEGRKDFIEMAKSYGYNATKHIIKTKDGYLNTLFRIKGNESKPVLLAHGVFDSADGWILRGNDSLGLKLCKEGYDVWFLNVRGNRYSRMHVTLNPDKDAAYWDFSVHELGKYDLAAAVDYALKVTKQTQLTLIGFSEGTSMSLVLAATDPEQNKKIKLCVCLAPVAYLHHTTGPVYFLIKFGTLIDFILPSFVTEIAGYFSLSKAFLNVLCTQMPFGYDLCYRRIISEIIGYNVNALEKTFFYFLWGHFPAGTSRKNLIHYSQIGQTGSFATYNYGPEKNMQKYGTVENPIYDLKNVVMDVMMVSGPNDRVSTIKDCQLLYEQLPNVIEWKIVDDPKYNHLDHMWANTAPGLVYSPVLEKLAKYHE